MISTFCRLFAVHRILPTVGLVPKHLIAQRESREELCSAKYIEKYPHITSHHITLELRHHL